MGVATATALVGAGISVYQTVKANKEKKDAAEEMKAYNRQELENPYENIQLSTYGTDIMREESARTIASLTDAAKSAGVRGVMSAIPRIQSGANQVSQQIGADLEQQDLKRQYAVAQGEEQIMGVKENRDNQNIGAISSQYNAANQDFNQGLWGAATGLASAANSYSQWRKENKEDK